MAFGPVSRAFLCCASLLVAQALLSSTARAETSEPQRIAHSIANQLTITIPLKQCQYPRFWSHGNFLAHEPSLTGGTPLGPTGSSSGSAEHSLREVRSTFKTLETRALPSLPHSEETTKLFHSIRGYFLEHGYTAPESLTIVDSKAPNAFVRKGREVVLTSAMARQVTDPSELAFVLAHEVAHVALGHHVQGGVSSEVAADKLALSVVTALGFNPCSGPSVLERLGGPLQLTRVSVTPRLDALHERTSSICG
jgi:hypothetical protein